MKFMKKIVKFALAIAVATTTLFVGSINVNADDPNYFYIKNTSGSNVSVKFKNSGKLKYSFNKNDWDDLPGSEGTPITISGNQMCYFRGAQDQGDLDSGNFIIGDGTVSVGGNVLSLLDPDPDGSTQMGEGAFFDLFMDCSSIVDASALELPDSVCQNCYKWMFLNCESLKKAPVLPAENMAVACYYGMFSGCKALETAPQLKSETLASSCYYKMFAGCTALKTAPSLPATNLGNADLCYEEMFSECTSLETAPELLATTLSMSCYREMFKGCSNLENPPSKLPATTLPTDCYTGMFKNCTNLETIPEIAAENFSGYSMFSDCTRLKKIVIIKQPKDARVREGGDATFSVTAQSTVSNELSYQWYKSFGNAGEFCEIPGARSLSYTISDVTKELNDTKYKCKIIDGANNLVESNVVILTVSKDAPPTNRATSESIAAIPSNFYFIRKTDNVSEKKVDKKADIDRDTYKSELPSNSVLAVNVADPKLFFDMKVHPTQARNVINQEFIAKNLLGDNISIILTKDIFLRRDLSINENGEVRTLAWNNLKDVPEGTVYAIVYNETDGAYLMNGLSDGKGTVTFVGFKTRPASTISIVLKK